jgi:hypothetical protein
VATAKALIELGKRDCFRAFFGEPTSHFRGLLIGEPEIAPILLFHNLYDVCHIRLPFGRPSQHPIENLFHLVSSHKGIIPNSLE